MLFCQQCGDEIEGVSDYHPFCSVNCEELYEEGLEGQWEEDFDLEDQFDEEDGGYTWDDDEDSPWEDPWNGWDG